MESRRTSDIGRTPRRVQEPDFQSLFEAAPGLYLVLTAELIIVAVTESYLHATMTTRDEILGRHLFDVFPDNPNDPSATGVGNLRASLERVLAAQSVDVMPIQKYDIRRPVSEGGGFEERYWSPVNSPFPGPGKQVQYIIHRVEDVTEFVHLKQRGREQDEMTDALRQRAQQMEAEVYQRGQELLAANQRLRTSNQLLNQLYRQIEELTIPADSAKAESRAESIAPDAMLARVEKLVASRNELEDQLRQSQKMEAVGQLAGGVAHDFNNLLTVIGGFDRLVLDELAPNDPLRSYAEQIQLASERAGALVKQLLAFSSRQLIQPKVLNLNELIRQMIAMLRRLLPESVELAFIPHPQLGNVRADRSQLEQVLMNLVVNARDAVAGQGRITIETDVVELRESDTRALPGLKPGQFVMMAVSDNGMGMDSETQKRIFEPFFTTKTAPEGTGLGLATVYGIIMQSQGQIWVYSEPEQGSTFRVYLPINDAPAEHAEPVGRPVPVEARGATVLVVEDEEAVRHLIVEILRRKGFQVLTASTVPEGIQALSGSRSPVDLLLTDVVLRGGSGDALAKEARRKQPGIKVLYMSGYTANTMPPHLLADSEIAFIPKPFPLETLLTTIHEVLAKA